MKRFKNIYKLFLLIIFSSLLSSCERLLIEPDPASSPEKNFEVFWSDIYNTYPYFEHDKIDWLEVYKKFKPQVTEKTSSAALFNIFSQMLEPLGDGHLSLTSADNKQIYYNKRFNTYEYNYNPNNVMPYLNFNQNYLTSPNIFEPLQTDTVGVFGIVKSNLIYLRLETYSTKFQFEKTVDSLNKAHPDAKGLILDLRFNGGGFLSTMNNFVGIFFTNKITYAYFKEKVGPLDDNYAPSEDFYISKTSYQPFLKPIAVLTNRFSASAAEHTVLALRKRENTTIVGDYTAGALSFIIQRTLPNKMQFTMVNSRTYDTDGNIFERVGIPPDELVSTPSNYIGRDFIIDKAVEILER